MLGRRLEYHSQKAVLLHMDANVRFKISLHMPSIRSVEKVVPLKMNKLFLTEVTTWVNGTFYEVGVDRLLPDGRAPETVPWREMSNWDYDEFGFPFVSGHDVLLPGDVSFQKENETFRFDTDENEMEYKQDLRHHEKALELLNDLNSKGETVEEYLESLANVPVETDEDEEVRNMLREEYLDDIVRRIEGYKQELLPFDCRRNNSKRQFECYITLSMIKKGASTGKRFEYTKKLFEASKYLNEVFFGGRTMPIRVKDLSLSGSAILRLPVGFRLRVQEASLCTGYPWKPLEERGKGSAHENFPLIVENLESLDCLKVSSDDLRLDGYKSQIVRNAKRLIIEGDERFMERNVIARVIGDLQNREIGIETRDYTTMSKEFYTTVIQNWLNGDRQVGACLWMANSVVETGRKIADEVLKSIETRYERSVRNERCVTVPLSNSTVMEVCSVPFEDSYWMLKLNILKV